MRTRLSLLMGHYMVLRGESIRQAELADFQLIKHPERVGVSPARSLALQLTNGKSNKNGKIQYGCAMRHRDPPLCTLGALAEYLFCRFEIWNHPAPDFQARRRWYNRKLLTSQNSKLKDTTEIKWHVQARDYILY